LTITDTPLHSPRTIHLMNQNTKSSCQHLDKNYPKQAYPLLSHVIRWNCFL